MKTLIAAAALLATFGTAQAQLSFTGGANLMAIGAYNPSGSTTTQTQGKEDSLISVGSGGTLTATFLGFEAQDTDTFGFNFGGGLITNKTGVADVTAVSGAVPAGNLVFSFVDTAMAQSVGNGGNPSDVVYASYAILGTFAGGVFTPYTKGGLYDLVLGFNDGLRSDADFDDLVVGLKLTPAVPEPQTYALLMAGLGAVGFVARRRNRRD